MFLRSEMKSIPMVWIVALWLLFYQPVSVANTPTFDNRFTKPLGQILNEISERFGVRLLYEVDTTGKSVPYADFRIRPYSVEESLQHILALFDYKFVKQNNKTYKIRAYEYMRRTPADGANQLAWLQSLYPDSSAWELRRQCLKSEVKAALQIEKILSQRVSSPPIWSKKRNYAGYSVQNFSMETLPGLYVNGSLYLPAKRGKHPLILCPNGHWTGGRFHRDEQIRFATLARMGAICVSYDLVGWGESERQVGAAAHRTPQAHTIQIMNGITILDHLLQRKDVDATRVAANGGSGGGSQAILLTVIDPRFSAVCPCESGMPIHLACGGTNNAELLALFAPKPAKIISIGGDWTASVPELEFPYLQRIYEFYHAKHKVQNVHLPHERHDFGPNKRKAVYQFFAETFELNLSLSDESKVTVEPMETLLSFGIEGQKFPQGAVNRWEQILPFFQ